LDPSKEENLMLIEPSNKWLMKPGISMMSMEQVLSKEKRLESWSRKHWKRKDLKKSIQDATKSYKRFSRKTKSWKMKNFKCKAVVHVLFPGTGARNPRSKKQEKKISHTFLAIFQVS
jgi:hypothetical protein